MLNIMRADLYRLFRSKGFYITTALFLMFIFMQITAGNAGGVGAVPVAVIDGSDSVIGITAHAELAEFTGITAPFHMMVSTDVLLFFILPLIIFIAADDFSARTVKNVLSNGVSRIKYYTAKLILSCIFCIIILSLNIVIPIIAGTIQNGFGGEFNTEFIRLVLRPFAAQLFMCLAVTCVGIFFVFVTKRTAAVIGAYVAFCLAPHVLIQMVLGRRFLHFSVMQSIQGILFVENFTNTAIILAFVFCGLSLACVLTFRFWSRLLF